MIMESVETRLREALQGLQTQINEAIGISVQDTVGDFTEQINSEIEDSSPAPSEPTYPQAPEGSEQGEPNEPIPENSRSLLIREETSRFSGSVWFEKVQEKRITLAGLGGIGGYVAFLLSRLRPAGIIMYDDDIVEEANMSGQLYCTNDLGKSKVKAMTDMMHSYSNFYSITALTERFEMTSEATDIMICGFDNMEARKVFYIKWSSRVRELPEEERKHCLFIDGRLAAEELQVLCIRGDDTYNMGRYIREWLFLDSQAATTQCSYKQTTFMANMIGSIIVNLFVNFCANDIEGENAPAIERDLPFLTTYDASMMMFTTEA